MKSLSPPRLRREGNEGNSPRPAHRWETVFRFVAEIVQELREILCRSFRRPARDHCKCLKNDWFFVNARWPFLCIFPGMRFYPVYRLRRSTGSFARIGSLLDPGQGWEGRVNPHVLGQAKELFCQEPGDRILLGPRCIPGGRGGLAEEAG